MRSVRRGGVQWYCMEVSSNALRRRRPQHSAIQTGCRRATPTLHLAASLIASSPDLLQRQLPRHFVS